MPIALALNIGTGAVLGATHRVLEPGCESDFAEQSAAAALRALGLDAKSAQHIANSPLKPVEILSAGLLTETSEIPAPAVAKTIRRLIGRRKVSWGSLARLRRHGSRHWLIHNSFRSSRTTHVAQSLSKSLSISDPVRISFDEFELDEANACLLRNGKAVALAPTPFNLLCALARQPGALLTKDALLDAVWGHQFVSESVLKTAISDLRTALGDNPREPRFIETVSRRGYRFIAVPAAAPPAPAARRRRWRRVRGRRRRSSAARTRSPGCSRRGIRPAAGSARWSGSPANRASARPR